MSMKNNERNIFEDIPANKFHSAVLTSFTMDLSHFDNQVLRQLQEKKVCSFNILMDQRQLDQYIDFAIPSVHHVGKEYTVTGIFAKGAFHPKLNMFVGDKDLLLLYGSGNLTVPGLGKNHEVFSGLYVNEDDKTQMPLMAEAWSYIIRHCKNIDGYVRKRIEKEIVENSSLLNQKITYNPHSYTIINKNLSIALLYNEKGSSIFDQMIDLIPFDEVNRITIVSPYYDSDGSAILGILEEAPKAKMDVLLQEDCQLPPNKMKQDKRIRFVDFDMTERGSDKTYNGFSYTPFLHAKLFHFTTKSGEYCIVGSANATEAALGVKEKPKNEEFCVLMFSPDRHFLKELGLTKRAPLEIDVMDIDRRNSNGRQEPNLKIRIDSIDYQNGITKIYYTDKNLKCGYCLAGFDKNGYCIFRKTVKLGDSPLKLEINEDTINQLLYFQLFDEAGCAISNKQIINDVESLDRTSPSPRNREINRLLSKVESGNYDGLEIMEFIGDLFDEAADDEYCAVRSSIGNSDYVNKKDDSKYDKPYVDWDEEDLNKNSRGKYYTTVSKLFECIEYAIKNKTQAINEELFGEEAEGNPVESANRDDNATSHQITKLECDQIINGINRFIQRYIELIQMRHQQVLDSKTAGKDIPYLNETDVKFFVLSIFSVLDSCYFKRQSYNFSQTFNLEREKHDFCINLSQIAIRSLRQMINDFTVFSIKCGGEKAGEEIGELVNSCMCYVFLAIWIVEKESHYIELKFIRQNFRLCLINLIDIYGKPNMVLIKEKLELLSNCFNGVFDSSIVFKYIQKVLDSLDENIYQKYENYGICLKVNKATRPLDYSSRL